MVSQSSLSGFLILLVTSACIGSTGALDISFNRLQCDESLPAFAVTDDVKMTCQNGESNRCSFGQEIRLEGSLQYNELYKYSVNGTGYASANLRLLSVEYNLFEAFPIDFCGNGITSYNNSDTECPYSDGMHYFNLPYTLPFDDDDITMWFATGWSGVSTLQVRNGYTDDSTLLVDCKLHWNTYVTPSQAEGFQTMPSAAQAGIVLASVLSAILCCCCYMVCCRRRGKHVTDAGYYDDFASYQIYQDKKDKEKLAEKEGAVDPVEASRL